MLDVLRSTTTTPGELCVMTVLTTETQTSPAICSDLGNYVSREAYRRGKIGHARLCVCVCLSLATCPDYYTDPGVTWAMV